jgi:hypothetical protein
VEGWDEFIKVTEPYAARRPDKFLAIAKVLRRACIPPVDGKGNAIENPFMNNWGSPPLWLESQLAEFHAEPTSSAQ